MSCKEPEPRVYKLTKDAEDELRKVFGKIESIALYTDDGRANHLRFSGETIVETNRCDGTCSVYEVPSDPRCCQDRKFLDIEVEKKPIDCNSPLVKQKTENKVVKKIVNKTLLIYSESGCDCTGGFCFHW